MRLLALTLTVGSIALFACGNEEEATAFEEAAGAASEVAEGKMEPKTEPPTVDAALIAELEKLVESYEIDVEDARIRSCPEKMDEVLIKSFRKGRDRAAAIDSFASMIATGDPKRKAVAAVIANEALKSFSDETKIDPASAKRLIVAVNELRQYQAASHAECRNQ